jgi:hypothetical protein
MTNENLITHNGTRELYLVGEGQKIPTIQFDVPIKINEECEYRIANMHNFVDFFNDCFKKHDVKLMNLSWMEDPKDYFIWNRYLTFDKKFKFGLMYEVPKETEDNVLKYCITSTLMDDLKFFYENNFSDHEFIVLRDYRYTEDVVGELKKANVIFRVGFIK